MPDGQRYFVVSQAAIFGVAVRRIGPLRPVDFVTPILLGQTENRVESTASELVAVLRATWDSGVQGTGILCGLYGR